MDFESRARERVARIGAAAATFVLVAALLRAPIELIEIRDPESPLGPQAVALVLHTLWGLVWIGQLLLALAAALNFSLARKGAPGGWALAAWMSVLLGFTPALSGHAIGSERLAGLAVLADAGHVLFAGAWLGGMLVLLALLLMPKGAGEERLAGLLVSSYSPVALASAAVVVTTGAVSALLHLTAWGDLLHSRYGQRLLFKIGAVVLMVALGAWNWRRAGPQLVRDNDDRPMRRSITSELVVGALVLLITAVLVVTPMPGED